MLLGSGDLDGYLLGVADLAERFGVVLDLPHAGPLELLEDDAGRLSYELRGSLAGRAGAPRARVRIGEEFTPHGRHRYERSRYAFELLDPERDFRRAFHLHDTEWFQRRHLVVVHEHCERPIGRVECAHYQGAPIRDGYSGVVALLDAWAADPPDCARLTCLE
jgi:hypothetical protein